jgi:dipeptidyl aminopeptidase/acylaminoacyl peptidase
MPIGSSRPGIDPKLMRPMEPITYTARDGLVIHGYITRPTGFEDKPAPLIVMPHGGPYGPRDSWWFDADTQFLTSRGYAVLRVNFRGSGGYGVKFMEKGRFEWGAKMQDDLTDAVKWAIEKGYADPKRIGWLGGSYGGYAVLAAAAFTPEIAKTAVNIVGVTDLTMISRLGGSRDTAYIFADTWLGSDMDVLRQRSIIGNVDKIQVPTFHAYGLNDPRVEIEHWSKLKSQLERHNKPYEYIVERYEGHGFQEAEARIGLMRRVEKFLAANL